MFGLYVMIVASTHRLAAERAKLLLHSPEVKRTLNGDRFLEDGAEIQSMQRARTAAEEEGHQKV
jgi:hypothetical protein